MGRYDLSGKVALVTGGARGIGFATARLLTEKGAHVTVLDLDPKATGDAAKELGPSALGIAGDVTSRSDVDAAIAATVERFGGLDIAIANAGTSPHGATMRAMDPSVFERVVKINLLGVYNTIHAALPQIADRQGQAVMIASIYAFTQGMLVTPYAATKAGVEQLGRALRVELAPWGASSTVAYYGFIDTAMVHEAFDQDPLHDELEAQMPRLLLKRLSPDQAAAALVRGMERRSPRVIAPKRWVPMSAFRGLIGPLFDRIAARRPGVRELIRRADDPDRPGGSGMISVAGSEKD